MCLISAASGSMVPLKLAIMASKNGLGCSLSLLISRIAGEHGQEHQLDTTIAFTEGMDGVQFGKKPGCFLREGVLVGGAGKVPTEREFAKKLLRLTLNVFRITKPVVALAGADRARFAGPIVDILEKVAMQGAVVREIQIAVRQRLPGTGIEHQLLEFIQLVLILDIGFIPQDMSAGIAQRILDGIIADHRQPFLKALTISLR